MHKKYLFPILIFAFAISGCLKDHSNYNYLDKEVITISGIESSYTVISSRDRLTLNPTAKSTDPNADFDYLWGIYETNVQGYAPILDTLAKTKDLDYLVNQPAKSWVLVYRVTNKKSGYSAFVTSTINVVTEFTRGWYVAKDDGTNSDMDLFLTPNSIVPEGVNENVYSKVNGHKLNGQADFLSFLSSYKSKVTGKLGNTRTLIMSTNGNIALMDINTLKEIRTVDNVLFVAPEVKKPSLIFNGSSAYYFINDGQLHTIYNMSANDGRFGARVMINSNNDEYRLSKYFLSYWIADPLLFDETSSSFFSMSMGYGSLMTAISDDTGTEMPAKNNNKTLLYMGVKAPSVPVIDGIAIFQDKDDPSLKILSRISKARSVNKIKIINDTLSTSDMLYNATNYTVLNGDEDLLYFVVGNEVWSRNLSNNFEKLEYTIPAGEEFTYIRHKKYTSESSFAFNFIMIGTKVGNKYKVRMFEKSSGSIVGEPKVILEGEGIARDVYYISPSVSETTNTLTY